MDFCVDRSVPQRQREFKSRALVISGARPSQVQQLGQYFLHSGTVRLGRPILANTAGS
jgi:hypothetical protein